MCVADGCARRRPALPQRPLDFARRIKRGKVGAAEFEFEEQVLAITQEAAEQGLDPERVATIDAGGPQQREPRAVVLESWLDVERAILELLEARGIGADHTRLSRRPMTAMRLATDAGLLDPAHVAIIKDLRATRNTAAHATDFRPSAESLAQFVSVARELSDALRRKSRSSA